jgi:hypothetical protein
MVDYLLRHHFILLPLLHLRSLEWEPSLPFLSSHAKAYGLEEVCGRTVRIIPA